jgi:hypothetical protein
MKSGAVATMGLLPTCAGRRCDCDIKTDVMNAPIGSELGARRIPDLTPRSWEIRTLLAVTFFYPIVICAVFFPTPTGDLREHINLGLTLPLYTWYNPPLQTWIAGIIALAGARDSWAFVLVAQVLNFIGLIYLVKTARKFVGPWTATPLVIMFCVGRHPNHGAQRRSNSGANLGGHFVSRAVGCAR